MKKVKGFTLLETEKEINDTINCSHEFKNEYAFETINPNGEYVVGYGHCPVSISVLMGMRCVKCGYFKKAT